MITSKAHIIEKLRKEIMPLEGLRLTSESNAKDVGLGKILYSFPNHTFPVGAIHEFSYHSLEEASATIGFVTGLLSSLTYNQGVVAWISTTKSIFPHALKSYGIEPGNILFIEVRQKKDLLWTIDQVLKCNCFTAIIANPPEMNFKESRRFQLSVEESGVTGFLLRYKPQNMATACVSRWRITPVPSKAQDGLPGLGFPHWKVELMKIRNGKPGVWQLAWEINRFRHTQQQHTLSVIEHRKTG